MNEYYSVITSTPAFVDIRFFDFGHSAWGKMKSQSAFILFSLMAKDAEHKIFLSHLCFIFENSLLHFKFFSRCLAFCALCIA